MARPRHHETQVDEEKLKHFSKKFEEGDPFPEVDDSKQEDPKVKSALYRFAEMDEPPEEKRAHAPEDPPADGPKEEPKAKPLTKAETLAIQQYQAKIMEVQQVKIRRPILTGFLFGVGLLLFVIALAVILFSISIVMGIPASELLGRMF